MTGDRRATSLAGVAAAAALLAVPAVARADGAIEAFPGHRVDLVTDGSIAGVALLGVLVPKLVSDIDTTTRWDRELLGGLDERVRDNFSSSAAKLSDGLLLTTMTIPAALMLGGRLDDAARDRFVLYSESLLVNGALASLAKYVVRRPRPYTYHPDPRVQAVARAQGDDSRLSFYSGHAALSFGAAVTGSYIHAASSTDPNARALVWGVELAAAAATANLRVRAGKHFYSDVIVGAVVGAGVGYLVPALHADDGAVYRPSGREYAAMGVGVAVGLLGSQLLPLRDDLLVRIGDAPPVPVTVQLLPMALGDGAGVGAIGFF